MLPRPRNPPQRAFPGLKEPDARGHLSSFGIDSVLATQTMYTLSGGQKNRVAFAKVRARPPLHTSPLADLQTVAPTCALARPTPANPHCPTGPPPPQWPAPPPRVASRRVALRRVASRRVAFAKVRGHVCVCGGVGWGSQGQGGA
jgi:hypothetical protein